MKSLHALTWLLGLGLSSSALAAPQAINGATHHSPTVLRGMTAAWPLGMIVPDASGGTDLLVRDGGRPMGAPSAWSAARFGPGGMDHPDFTKAAIQQVTGAGVITKGVSTGNDIIPDIATTFIGGVGNCGKLNMGPYRGWFALSVMVNNGAEGTNGSLVHQIGSATPPESPGGTLFSYYAAGSTGIVAELVDSVVMEQDRASMGFGPPTGQPHERVDVGDVDYGIGVISDGPPNGQGLFFRQYDTLYFTVAKDSPFVQSTADNPFTVLEVGGVHEPNAATIYSMTWAQQAGGTSYAWGDLSVAFTPSDLGLDAAAGDELDSIAVFHGLDRVIFSTTVQTDSASQLLVSQIVDPNGPRSHLPTIIGLPLAAPDDVLVTDKLGLVKKSGGTEADEITGTCGADPETSAGVVTADARFGTPWSTAAFAPGTMAGLSLLHTERYTPASDQGPATAEQRVHMSVEGLTVEGSSPLFVAFFVTAQPLSATPGSQFTLDPLQPQSAWTYLDYATLAPQQTSVFIEAPVVPLPPNALKGAYGVIGVVYGPTSDGLGPIRATWISAIER